jgi:hypothetical protein
MRKSKLQNILTKEILEYEYNSLGSMQKVADKLDVGVDSIYKYMKLYNVPYIPHYNGLYDCNESIFQTDTEKSFYLAGFIAADGSLQKRKYSKILKITLSKKDASHLEKIKVLLDSNHPIKEYLVKPSKLIKTAHKCVELQITSNQIFNDLARFNIMPNKTKTYTIPSWIFIHPLANHYMRGYFDGDGTITACGLGNGRTIKQGSFSLIGTYKFIQVYQSILVNQNLVNENKITKCKNVWKISYSGNNIIHDIYWFFYGDATTYLERKKNKFELFL